MKNAIIALLVTFALALAGGAHATTALLQAAAQQPQERTVTVQSSGSALGLFSSGFSTTEFTDFRSNSGLRVVVRDSLGAVMGILLGARTMPVLFADPSNPMEIVHFASARTTHPRGDMDHAGGELKVVEAYVEGIDGTTGEAVKFNLPIQAIGSVGTTAVPGVGSYNLVIAFEGPMTRETRRGNPLGAQDILDLFGILPNAFTKVRHHNGKIYIEQGFEVAPWDGPIVRPNEVLDRWLYVYRAGQRMGGSHTGVFDAFAGGMVSYVSHPPRETADRIFDRALALSGPFREYSYTFGGKTVTGGLNPPEEQGPKKMKVNMPDGTVKEMTEEEFRTFMEARMREVNEQNEEALRRITPPVVDTDKPTITPPAPVNQLPLQVRSIKAKDKQGREVLAWELKAVEALTLTVTFEVNGQRSRQTKKLKAGDIEVVSQDVVLGYVIQTETETFRLRPNGREVDPS